MTGPARIYIVGFMGSGKTTCGSALAERLGYGFADLDRKIEEAVQMPVPDIFRVHGETFFREMETAVLHTTRLLENFVIATGGGTPAHSGNMEWMNGHGHTIFLDVPAEILAERLAAGTSTRPLLQKLQGEALLNRIRQLLEERLPYYRMARETIAWPGITNEALFSGYD